MKLKELKEYLNTIDNKYDDYQISSVLLSQDEAENTEVVVYEDRQWLRVTQKEK